MVRRETEDIMRYFIWVEIVRGYSNILTKIYLCHICDISATSGSSRKFLQNFSPLIDAKFHSVNSTNFHTPISTQFYEILQCHQCWTAWEGENVHDLRHAGSLWIDLYSVE